MDSDDLIREGMMVTTVGVRDIYLLRISCTGLDFKEGGMSEPTAIAHFVIADLPNERAFIVPVNKTGINALIGQMTHVLDEAYKEVGENEKEE